jgi:hypothetical protein
MSQGVAVESHGNKKGWDAFRFLLLEFGGLFGWVPSGKLRFLASLGTTSVKESFHGAEAPRFDGGAGRLRDSGLCSDGETKIPHFVSG